MEYTSLLKSEFFSVVNNMSITKQISKLELICIVKDALMKVIKNQYGEEKNIKLHISLDNKIYVWLYRDIVDNVNNSNLEISKEELEELEVKFIKDGKCAQLMPLKLDENGMSIFKSHFHKSMRELEKIKIYKLYSGREGELVTGTVKHVDTQYRNNIGKEVEDEQNIYGGVVLDMYGYDAYMRNSETISGRDRFKVGDIVNAVIYKVRIDPEDFYVVFLSRKRSEFISAILTQSIPEIAEKKIEIKKIARIPGIRSKVIVHSNSSIDAVGTCVGNRGSRINNITSKINESIDIIKWDDNLMNQISLCFKGLVSPNEIKVVDGIYTIVVDESKKKDIIGAGGQNIKLISNLLNIDIKVLNS